MPIQYPGRALAIGLLTLAGDVGTAGGQPASPLKAASSSQRSALVRELEGLTEGLLFVSELDAPLAVITWARPGGRPTRQRLAALVGEPHPELVEQVTLDSFFRAALRVWPGQSAEDEVDVRRYRALVHFLKTRLGDAQVFRFGHVMVRSYVIGVAPNGDWLGLTTNQTET